MAQTQPTTFGATVIKTTPAKTQEDLPALTPAVSNDSYVPSHADQTVSPCSPFYQHPPASNERVPAAYHLKTPLDISVVEKGSFLGGELTPSTLNDKNPFCSTVSVNTSKECTMWPSRQTLVNEKAQLKKQKRATRSCACADLRHNWDQMSKKNKLIVRLVLALILVGAMIGLGVGISKAVNGSYRLGNAVST